MPSITIHMRNTTHETRQKWGVVTTHPTNAGEGGTQFRATLQGGESTRTTIDYQNIENYRIEILVRVSSENEPRYLSINRVQRGNAWTWSEVPPTYDDGSMTRDYTFDTLTCSSNYGRD